MNNLTLAFHYPRCIIATTSAKSDLSQKNLPGDLNKELTSMLGVKLKVSQKIESDFLIFENIHWINSADLKWPNRSHLRASVSVREEILH